jgi:cell division septation protein DedD
MKYTLVLTRGTLLLLAAGGLTIGLLFFLAGITVGLAMWQPTQADIQLARAYREKSAPAPSARQTEPAPQPVVAAAPPPPPADDLKPSPAGDAVVIPAVEPASLAASLNVAKPAEAAPVAREVPAATAAEFAVQVGAFLDPKNAAEMQKDLKERNIATTLFKGYDGSKRVWHAVRLAQPFGDLASASRAAADFTGKEQIQALVRRANTL